MEVAVYYKKPIVKLGEMKPGDYVYDSDANLCYIDEEYHMHHYAIESWCSKETIVYPITLQTTAIMERMRQLRQKYCDSNIMNAEFSRELENALYEIMCIDVNDEKYGDKEEAKWVKLEQRYQELVVHAKALHIYRDPDEKRKWREQRDIARYEASEAKPEKETIWHSGDEVPSITDDDVEATLYFVVLKDKEKYTFPSYTCSWNPEKGKKCWEDAVSESCGFRVRLRSEEVEKWALLEDVIGK